MLVHQDMLEGSYFTARFVCRISAARPDWRPIRKSFLVGAELVTELHLGNLLTLMALQPAYQPIRAPVQTQIRWLCLWRTKA